MLDNNILKTTSLKRHIPGPAPKTTICIDCSDPFIQSITLGFVLWAIAALNLKA